MRALRDEGRIRRSLLLKSRTTITETIVERSLRETMTSSAPLEFDSERNNQPGQNRLNWKITNAVLVSFHVGASGGALLFLLAWDLFVAIFLYWMTGGLGLGICFHRLLTHRSFATLKWFEYFLTICAVTALEGGPLLWVATHRKHHRFADRDG